MQKDNVDKTACGALNAQFHQSEENNKRTKALNFPQEKREFV